MKRAATAAPTAARAPVCHGCVSRARRVACCPLGLRLASRRAHTHTDTPPLVARRRVLRRRFVARNLHVCSSDRAVGCRRFVARPHVISRHNTLSTPSFDRIRSRVKPFASVTRARVAPSDGERCLVDPVRLGCSQLSPAVAASSLLRTRTSISSLAEHVSVMFR